MKTGLVRTMFFAAALSTLLLAGCAQCPPTNGSTQPAPPLLPATSGAQQARRDIAAGRLQVMEAGTRGVYASNVPADQPFARLPRHRLPSGCIDPNAQAWIRYAEAYNAVLVAHVRKQAPR